MVCIFFGEEFSFQESCDKHVLIDQKRCVSEENSALDSGRDGLGPLSLLIHAGTLCPEGDLTRWEERPTCSPWDWSAHSLRGSCGPWGSTLSVPHSPLVFHHSPLLFVGEKLIVAVSWTYGPSSSPLYQ